MNKTDMDRERRNIKACIGDENWKKLVTLMNLSDSVKSTINDLIIATSILKDFEEKATELRETLVEAEGNENNNDEQRESMRRLLVHFDVGTFASGELLRIAELAEKAAEAVNTKHRSTCNDCDHDEQQRATHERVAMEQVARQVQADLARTLGPDVQVEANILRVPPDSGGGAPLDIGAVLSALEARGIGGATVANRHYHCARCNDCIDGVKFDFDAPDAKHYCDPCKGKGADIH